MFGVVNPPSTNVSNALTEGATATIEASQTESAPAPGGTAGSGAAGCTGNDMGCWVQRWMASVSNLHSSSRTNPTLPLSNGPSLNPASGIYLGKNYADMSRAPKQWPLVQLSNPPAALNHQHGHGDPLSTCLPSESPEITRQTMIENVM